MPIRLEQCGETNESDNTWERAFNWIARIGYVFNPNPVVTSGDTTLRDNHNQDRATLTNQQATLQGLDGTGYLRGSYVNLTAPGMTGAGTRCDASVRGYILRCGEGKNILRAIRAVGMVKRFLAQPLRRA